ncbi:MAG: HTH domain-containing protein, partial [Clostridium sp.]
MNRKEKIIEILNASGIWIKSNDLAKLLGVTTRTIRIDIKEIKKTYGEEFILSSKQKGYMINTSLIDNNKYFKVQSNYDKKERMLIILKRLIVEEEGVNVFDLGEELFVSDSTIEGDIQNLKNFIKELNMGKTSIKRKEDVYKLISNEVSREDLFFEIAFNKLDYSTLIEFQVAFQGIDIRKLYKILRESLYEKEINLKYISFVKLTLEVAILLEIDTSNREIIRIEEAENSKVYEVVQSINNRIIEEFNINFLDSSKSHLVSKLEKIKRISIKEKEIREKEDLKDEESLKILNILEELNI